MTVVNTVSGEALDRVVRFPPSMDVELEVGGEAASEDRLVFRPTGSLAGRTTSVVITDGDRRHAILVTGSTGSVVLED
jgi:hypothetical protein